MQSSTPASQQMPPTSLAAKGSTQSNMYPSHPVLMSLSATVALNPSSSMAGTPLPLYHCPASHDTPPPTARTPSAQPGRSSITA